MAFDFPGPGGLTVGQQVTPPGGGTYQWDNVKWIAVPGSAVFAPVNSPVLTGDPQAPTAAVGDNDQSIATTAFVQAAVAPALNDAGRNLIHNPMFNVAQRGTGPFTSSVYTLDRWRAGINLDTTGFSQVALNDTNRAQIRDEAATYCLQVGVTGNAGAASFSMIQQLIEDVRRLAGKTVTVSFWANTGSGTPKLGVSIDQWFGTGGSPSAIVSGNGQAVTISTTFARYSLTFTLPSVAGKTFGTNGDNSTQLCIWYSAGSTSATRSGNIGVQSQNTNIWGVQLEIGSVATPLEKLDPQQDLSKCQRFYYGDTTALAFGFNSWAAGAYSPMVIALPVAMRTTPTITIGTASSPVNVSTVTASGQCPTRFVMNAFAGGAGGATVSIAGYTASADL